MSYLAVEEYFRLLGFGRMKKCDMVKSVARERGVTAGDAADRMDRAVDRLVRALRSGQPAHVPGVGTITPGKRWTFRQEKP